MSQTLADMIDSNNFFEGVEKLLEVWFTRKDGMTANCDLRKIPRSQLDPIMEVVRCEIISSCSSDEVDAYVLSESSMFISSSRFILKTCGTTTPLLCLPQLITLVQEYSGFDDVQDLFYSRKNFKRPELQVTPHRNFQEEAEILNQFFPGKGGRAYCLGSLNGDDRWYLYYFSAASNRYDLVAKQNLPPNRLIKSKNENDQTLEILMTGVDPKKMVNFYKENCSSANEATKRSGIGNLIPGMTIDDFLFEPCGYSMNGVSKTVPGGYMTIHITPEPEFSYVSFETNIHHKNYRDLIKRVVRLFGPTQFVVTFFSSEDKNSKDKSFDDETQRLYYDDYYAQDLQFCQLTGYYLTYALFNRFPS